MSAFLKDSEAKPNMRTTVAAQQCGGVEDLVGRLRGMRVSTAMEAASLIQTQVARIAELEAGLSAAIQALEEAEEDVEHWGGYASEYFRDKHDLDGDLDRIAKQANAARVLLNKEGRG